MHIHALSLYMYLLFFSLEPINFIIIAERRSEDLAVTSLRESRYPGKIECMCVCGGGGGSNLEEFHSVEGESCEG